MDYHYWVDGSEFEWDEDKAEVNLRKHGVSFELACEVFFDRNALSIADNSQAYAEDRFLTLGMAGGCVVLLVVSTDRDRRIRLISARKATNRETQRYFRR